MQRGRRRGGRATRARQYRSRWGNVVQDGRSRTGGFYGRYNHQHAKPELKFHDLQNLDTNPVTAIGSIPIDSFLKIQSGTGESQRIGRNILVKKMSIKFTWTFLAQQFAGNAHSFARIIIYCDKQANGATASVNDILEDGAGMLSFRELENIHRFRILADRKYAITPTCGAGNGTTDNFTGGYIQDEIHVNMNLPVEYSGVLGLITEIKSNNIAMLLISHAGRVKFESSVRIRYEG